MRNIYNTELKNGYFKIIDFLLIFFVAIIPLLTSFNYRINIFLAWEGAYRMAIGQMPYKDFGTPVGFGFWLVPSLFFKVLGPQLLSLVKAQVFLNIVSGLSFRQILKNFKVQSSIVSLSVLVFCISFTFINAWPWYNHTVIVFQLLALAIITNTFNTADFKKVVLAMILGGFFLILSFFTKQDAGFLGLLIGLIITAVYSILSKNYRHIFILIMAVAAWASLIVFSLNDSFYYWFNHGQAPHSSRLSLYDILNEFFIGSQYIKLYIFGIIIVILHRLNKNDKIEILEVLFTLLFLGILAEAAIFQVTSYVPENNNIFFHSFAIGFFGWYMLKNNALDTQKPVSFVFVSLGIFLIWSVNYWKYADRIMQKFRSPSENISATGENVVNKSNYIKDTYFIGNIPSSEWKTDTGYVFTKIKMPQSTIDGINRLRKMPEMQNAATKKVLNMSELTPLAYELGFNLETGAEYPLWHHLGVGMFNKQLKMFSHRISNQYYDVIIYEHLPHLNNFYPLVLKNQLGKDYKLVDTFLAPRNPTNSNIEVYIKK